ncbi:MAG: sodium:proton antiporter [Chlorobiaceae bacterium]
MPPLWLAAPFVLLLLLIATGPLFYRRFWEHHYPKVSLGLGVLVAVYYCFAMDRGPSRVFNALEEYISFMALISALFAAAGGVLIRIGRRGSPLVNGALLFAGAILANLIGTTGASMLLIRPYLRINEGRLKAFHTVFFIFIVSNIGGALTPIGDPPLFLGFLKGVPFFWVLSALWRPWLLAISLLILLFMALDALAGKGSAVALEKGGGLSLGGGRSLIWLPLIIGAVFLDPAVFSWVPSLQERVHLPFGIREILLFALAAVAWKSADREALRANGFSFSPIREVAFLFLGIFVTMIPALQLAAGYAASHAGELSVTRFYWMAGLLSGVLDNAPTYMSALSGAMGKFGFDIGSVSDMHAFASGTIAPQGGGGTTDVYLMAISVGSVFFGSMTYIGNAPNFMVRSIAEEAQAEVPGFIGYLCKYSIPVLLPLFLLVWWLFFNY